MPITGLELYKELLGESVSLFQNSEFLDSGYNGGGGWHDLGLGTTQVVTYYDDGSLSSTPNAVGSFLGG